MTGDITFMFICTLLVFFMTPGLALFYGGMVRRKNVLNTMMLCLSMIGIGIVMWVAIGYSLSFGRDIFGIIGGFDKIFFNNVSMTFDGKEIPEVVSAIFNMMFSVISPAIIMGSLAERVRFSRMVPFCVLWSLLVYYPLSHLTWGGGLLEQMGALDFAGGTVIHISTGVSGLAACLIIGGRRGFHEMAYHPHNIPMFVTGAAILWTGWFGFNCGCAGGANETALLALCNTAVSSACGMLAWMLMEVISYRKCTVMGSMTGGIAGLVGITPGAGYVPIWSSFLIGATTAVICYFIISRLKKKLGFDDALDAFGCHGAGGIWGCLMTGVFATTSASGSAGGGGIIEGSLRLFGVQIVSIVAACAVAVVMTILITFVLRLAGTLRVSDLEEAQGLDIIEHGERAYPAFNGLD